MQHHFQPTPPASVGRDSLCGECSVSTRPFQPFQCVLRFTIPWVVTVLSLALTVDCVCVCVPCATPLFVFFVFSALISETFGHQTGLVAE